MFAAKEVNMRRWRWIAHCLRKKSKCKMKGLIIFGFFIYDFYTFLVLNPRWYIIQRILLLQLHTWPFPSYVWYLRCCLISVCSIGCCYSGFPVLGWKPNNIYGNYQKACRLLQRRTWFRCQRTGSIFIEDWPEQRDLANNCSARGFLIRNGVQSNGIWDYVLKRSYC